jgi:hypothetical protein
MSKAVNLGSVMEGIFAIAIGLILCESDLPSRQLTAGQVNSIRRQINFNTGSFKKRLFRGKQRIGKYAVDNVEVNLVVNLKLGEAGSAYGKKYFENTKESVIQRLIGSVVQNAARYKKLLTEAKNEYLLNQKPDVVKIDVIADGVAGEQTGGDIKGDVMVTIMINGKPALSNQNLNFSLKAGTTPSKTLSNESPHKSLLRVSETFNLGINPRDYQFLDEVARSPQQKYQKVVYTKKLYDAVLKGMNQKFSASGRVGSQLAWQLLKNSAFGSDYAQVVSISPRIIKESSPQYINALQERYPDLEVRKTGEKIQFYISELNKPLFYLRFKNRSSIIGPESAEIKEMKLMIETDKIFYQPNDFDPKLNNIGV